jgi:hypothetical protein
MPFVEDLFDEILCASFGGDDGARCGECSTREEGVVVRVMASEMAGMESRE